MADTKRGRERKGRVKRRQAAEYEIDLELAAMAGDPLDFETLYDEE